MKTNFFSFAAVATVAIISLVLNTATLQAQDTDWTQTPEYQQMYNDLMGTVNKTYEDTYNEGMNSANKIMEQQKADEQRYYNELMDMVNKTYEDTYAEYEAIFNQIIANANANAKVMEAQLIAQGQAVYQQALARGMSDAAAQQAAVKTVGNIASTNSITNSFGHDLTMKISNNWPNGSGALYQYSDGSVGNWATRY
jgi:hypothetical protein